MKANRLLRGMMLYLGTAMCIGLCGCTDSGNTSRGTIDDVRDDETAETTPADTPAAPDIIDPNFDVYTQDLDYTSEKALLEFVSGEWYLADKKSGKDIGVLTIGTDGSCEYIRIGGSEACKGSFGFKHDYYKRTEGLDQYEITLKDLPQEYTEGKSVMLSGSDGYFHIAQSAGQDYLYLEETGNGGSELVYCVFNDPASDDFVTRWVFHRDNEVTETAAVQTGRQFYAMLWNNDGNELLLQEMNEVSFETAGEYSDFKYMGAVFDESAHPDAIRYEKAATPELGMVMNKDIYNSYYPGKIYTVITDANGQVTELADVNEAGYGEYELYALEQDISYSGTTFTCNGRNYSLEELGNVGNAIEDVTTYDEYAIIQAHMNPHISVYTIFDMSIPQPVRTVAGGAFLVGDNIWDFFYSNMNQVYDGDDELICEVDGTEIVNLSFTDDDQHIKVEYWKDDYTTVYEEIIDRPENINAPCYAYAAYRHSRRSADWAELMKYAPDDAKLMVMVNPTAGIWEFMQPMPMPQMDMGTDTIYVISLQDDIEVSLDGKDKSVLDRGAMAEYHTVIPEGMASESILGETADGYIAEWPVMIISGKDKTRWMFVR